MGLGECLDGRRNKNACASGLGCKRRGAKAREEEREEMRKAKEQDNLIVGVGVMIVERSRSFFCDV